jgi:uncharacterized protein YeaO (DUF488 family)
MKLSPAPLIISYHMPFDVYTTLFLEEMRKSSAAQAKIDELMEFVFKKQQKLTLICFEKNPMECHRWLVRDLIIKAWQKTIKAGGHTDGQ